MNIQKILIWVLVSVLCLAPCALAETEMPEQTQTALDLSASLFDAPAIILPDGSLLEYVIDFSDGDQYRLYQGMDIKSFASYKDPGIGLLALTKDNALYYMGEKIADNVTSVEFCKNYNSGIYATANGNTYYFSIEWTDETITQSPYARLEGCNVASVEDYEYTDAFVLMADCTLQLSAVYGSENAWMSSQFEDWTDLVYADAAKFAVDGELVAFTVAGIQKDGTVLVAGDFAEEILSWGELSYISMDYGTIVGLLKDGSIRITGMQGAAFWMNCPEMHWENIASVHVGKECITAIGTDGKYYFARFDYDTRRPNVAVASPDEVFDAPGHFLRFMSDGTLMSANDPEEGWYMP